MSEMNKIAISKQLIDDLVDMSNNRPRVSIPDGLHTVLRDFTIEVLRSQPTSVNQFAAAYFQDKWEEEKLGKSPLYVVVDDDDAAISRKKVPMQAGLTTVAQEPVTLQRVAVRSDSAQFRSGRRKSVFGERVDPAELAVNSVDCTRHPKTDEQRSQLLSVLSSIVLFRDSSRAELGAIVDAMFERRAQAGETVITQVIGVSAKGEDGDNFYIIEKGQFDCFVTGDDGTDKRVASLDAGYFGELALMYNQPRAATVRATVDNSTLWAMDRRSFQCIVLSNAFKRRKIYDEFLLSVPMLGTLEPYERQTLADALIAREYHAGECIIREGEQPDGMFFLEEGEATVTIGGDGSEVNHLKPGDYFGELALIEKSPRTASVYARTDVRVAFLERGGFERLLGPCMDVMKRQKLEYTMHH